VSELTVPLSDKFILSGIKGILPESKTSPGIYFTKNLGLPQAQFLVLSGPSHAEEVAEGQPVF
jgi:glycerol-3-phosphate dehydrogenase (NAD(P)+)